MFLFTTPPASDTSRNSAVGNSAVASTPVLQAIRDGAEKTGTGFDFLVRTAQRESALDPNAKAGTSSATGLFQFIDQTWLGMIKEQGARHGLAAYADAINNDGGRMSVADPKLKQDILDLRRDPNLASVMAGALTQKNREALTPAIGRAPSQGELYVAHVMGARGAAELINGMANAPQSSAAAMFPDAAAANRSIFFDKAGNAKPVSEVYAMLTASHSTDAAVTATGFAEVGQAPQAAQAFPGVVQAKGLVGLFSTEGSRAPVSEAVTKYWATPRAGGRLASVDSGPRFFPRDGAAAAIAPVKDGAAMAELPAAEPVLVDAPLPPSRPALLASVDGAKARGPLELSRFLKGRWRS